jgi:integrase
VSPATAVRYRHIVQRRLIPALGYIPLLRLSPQSIQRYLADVMSSGLSPSTALYDYRVLHAALARAERWGYIGRNPARHVDPPSPAPREATIWDEEQVRLFLADAKRHSPYYALYLTAVLTGLRQGELLGLRWRDVDLAIGTVQVRQTIYRLYGAGRQDPIVAKAPKSRKSRRVVPIPRVVRAVLMELRDATAYGSRPDWTRLVFCQPNGKPLHAANIVRRDFHARIARLGLPRIRFHDLRHTYASHLYRLCRDASVVRDALGHASSAFTLDTYDHPISSLMLQASEELAGRLQHSAYEQEIERTC